MRQVGPHLRPGSSAHIESSHPPPSDPRPGGEHAASWPTSSPRLLGPHRIESPPSFRSTARRRTCGKLAPAPRPTRPRSPFVGLRSRGKARRPAAASNPVPSLPQANGRRRTHGKLAPRRQRVRVRLAPRPRPLALPYSKGPQPEPLIPPDHSGPQSRRSEPTRSGGGHADSERAPRRGSAAFVSAARRDSLPAAERPSGHAPAAHGPVPVDPARAEALWAKSEAMVGETFR